MLQNRRTRVAPQAGLGYPRGIYLHLLSLISHSPHRFPCKLLFSLNSVKNHPVYSFS